MIARDQRPDQACANPLFFLCECLAQLLADPLGPNAGRRRRHEHALLDQRRLEVKVQSRVPLPRPRFGADANLLGQSDILELDLASVRRCRGLTVDALALRLDLAEPPAPIPLTYGLESRWLAPINADLVIPAGQFGANHSARKMVRVRAAIALVRNVSMSSPGGLISCSTRAT